MRKTLIIIYSITMLLLLTSCGNDEEKYLSLEEVSAESINETLMLAGQYILQNQFDDGRIDYLYYPDRKLSDGSNNMIRQFMTTTALSTMHEYTGEQRYLDAYRKNIDFNIRTYYKEDSGLGYIFYENVNLGAAALAYISLIQEDPDKFTRQKQKLLEFIYFMHNESDGRFYTFHIPRDNYINQRFYSGEAMLALMEEYERSQDPQALETAQQAFEFYKDYFVGEEKRPAFVPWHTMANYKLYKATGDRKHMDFALESNDWLIGMLDDTCRIPEYQGRFYDEKTPQYGIPHASSTAVYMEGLAYAYRMAKEINDVQRMESYKKAMILGARSLMELQFKEEDVERRDDADKILGGMRTSMGRYEIRIDNNQHTIMALMNMLEVLSEDEIDEFIEDNHQYFC